MVCSKILYNALVAAPVFFGTTQAIPRLGSVQARGNSAAVAVPAGSCGGDGGDKKITIDIVLTPGVAGQVVGAGSGGQGGLSVLPGGVISKNGGSTGSSGSSSSNNGGSSSSNNGGSSSSNNNGGSSSNPSGGSTTNYYGGNTNNYGGSSSNSNSGSVNANGGSVSGSGNSNNANANNNSNGGISINNVNNNNNNIQLPTGWIAKPTVTTYTYTVTNGFNHTSTGTTTQTITVTVPVTPTGGSSVGSSSLPSSGAISSPSSHASSAPSTTTTTSTTPTPSSCALSKCAAGQIGTSALTIVNALNSTDALIKDLLTLTDPLKGSPQGQIDAKKVGSAIADIVSAIIDDIGLLKDIKPFDLECDATAVYYALEAVLGSIEAVADLLIGKGGIVDSVPILGPIIAFGIRAIEKPIAALVEDVLNLIPHLKLCTGSGPFGTYQGTIGQAIGVKNPGFCYTPSDCALGQISERAQSVVNTLDAIDKVASDFVNANFLKLLGDVVVSAHSHTFPISCFFANQLQSLGTNFLSIFTNIVSDLGKLTSIKPFDLPCDAYAIATALSKIVTIVEKAVNLFVDYGAYFLIGSVGVGIYNAVRDVLVGLIRVAINLIPAQACDVAAQLGNVAVTLAKSAK